MRLHAGDIDTALTSYRDTLYAARMARDIMWEGERALDLDHFVAVSQTYVLTF